MESTLADGLQIIPENPLPKVSQGGQPEYSDKTYDLGNDGYLLTAVGHPLALNAYYQPAAGHPLAPNAYYQPAAEHHLTSDTYHPTTAWLPLAATYPQYAAEHHIPPDTYGSTTAWLPPAATYNIAEHLQPRNPFEEEWKNVMPDDMIKPPEGTVEHPSYQCLCTSGAYVRLAGRSPAYMLQGFTFQFDESFKNFLWRYGLASLALPLEQMIDRLTTYTYGAGVEEVQSRRGTLAMLLQFRDLAAALYTILDMECEGNGFWKQCSWIEKTVEWEKKRYTLRGRLLAGCFLVDTQNRWEIASSGVKLCGQEEV